MQKHSGTNQQNTDDWGFGQSQPGNEEVFDDESMVGSRTQSIPHSSLRQEAIADFKALDGYWNKIIGRDMRCKGDDFLPEMLIV